jgi:hypothetical protein
MVDHHDSKISNHSIISKILDEKKYGYKLTHMHKKATTNLGRRG